jgi:monoamine oxidase
MPWDSMEIEDRVHETLENLSRIFGEQVHSEFLIGDSFSWVRFPYSAGAYAMLRPEQFTGLYPYTYTPEGRVHFAGEHTSSVHGWLQGAIESAIDVALEVNNIS